MKITFSNLGAIKKTTLDLRPLTVIIGPNNSNKTYIAYSIYGLLQKLREDNKEFFGKLKIIKESTEKLKIVIDDNFYNSVRKYLKKVFKSFSLDLDTFFQDSTHRLFTKTLFDIEISNDEIREAMNKIVLDVDAFGAETFPIEYSIDNNIFTAESKFSISYFDKEYSFEEDTLDTLEFLLKFYLFKIPSRINVRMAKAFI